MASSAHYRCRLSRLARTARRLWGARDTVMEDPDGIAVGAMSPVSPDMKSPPPEV